MADVLEQAERLEQLSRDIAISNAKSINNEPPEFDKNGDRVCIDCFEVIIKARVKAVNAVRCVVCQSENDKLSRIYT